MDIYSMTRKQLERWFSERGENPAKAAVLFRELYQNNITSFEKLAFSERVRTALSGEFSLELPETLEISSDGSTEKQLLRLNDGSLIETVLMRQKYGGSVCVSSQVGCAMGCKFCQSGRLLKRRNLTAGEMLSQVLKISRREKIHSVTVMGIGEPFDNTDEVLRFCDILTDSYGLALGEKHVTISTCGVIEGIERLSAHSHPVNLAVSLHAADNDLRSGLMPINRKYPVKDVIKAAAGFAEIHNRRVTLEYILLNEVNDGIIHAERLAELVGGYGCFYVNLIPFNSNDSVFSRSTRERIAAFYDILKKRKIPVTMRREFGGEIAAACGQLAGRPSPAGRASPAGRMSPSRRVSPATGESAEKNSSERS